MRVILVHGLGRTRLSLALLGRRLAKSGHSREFFPYSVLTESHDRILARLINRLRYLAAKAEVPSNAVPGSAPSPPLARPTFGEERRPISRLCSVPGQEVGLVGHSFGGLLLREAVAAVPELRVKHLIMLATPNRQPRLAVRVYGKLPFRLLRGSCGQRLTDASWFRSLPVLSVPYTIVAGTRGWRGRFDPFRGEPNDCTVAVSETLARDDDRPFLVKTTHTFIMNNRSVHRLVVEKLGTTS